jgi:hypothetical protein
MKQAMVGAVAAPGGTVIAAEERTIAFRHANAREATDAALRWMRDPLLSEGFHVTSVIVTPEGEGFVATVSYRG